MSRWGETDADRARARRDGTILELWAMGRSRAEIAERYGITPQRVSQIVYSVGDLTVARRRRRANGSLADR